VTVFESTPADIAALSPDDLRQLMRRLCEAELADLGYPRSAVTSGGHPLAADGGVDVRVQVEAAGFRSDFLPEPLVLFQVKQESGAFGPAKIREEMAPKGGFRPALAEAAQRAGAYIIVSGKETLTDRPLRERRRAIRAVLAEHGVPGLREDFYDGARIAQWVDRHPAVALWLRDRLGKPVFGWQPFASWSSPEEAPDAEYIPDEKARLSRSTQGKQDAQPIIAGIEAIRALLARPGGIVRVVGLSGTGKTRLAQALFDERIGTNAIPRELALYADAGAEPQPSPREMLARLAAERRRNVLVIDNAGADLHRDLADELRRDAGQVSLLTIEYDITPDEPEATDVFRLDVASDAVIRSLLERRANDVSATDREAIVRLSDGNARVALALARAARETGSFGGLNDRQIFERLLWQRGTRDDTLLRTAEICSLVYSFSVEDSEFGPAEHLSLAALAGQDAAALYRHVAELHRRSLVQARSVWRAVLPQALALHLAARAIENIAPTELKSFFEGTAPSRLRLSFTRQIGHLHKVSRACSLADEWLHEGGFLSQRVAAGDRDAMNLVANLAPLAPRKVLDFVERRFAPDQRDTGLPQDAIDASTIVSLLSELAYEADLFERAATLLARIILASPNERLRQSWRGQFADLFSACLSGTHAPFEARAAVIRSLAGAGDADSIELAGHALGHLLHAGSFTRIGAASFGAHARDHGYEPKTWEDLIAWYLSGLSLVRELAHGPAEAVVRRSFVSSLRGLVLVHGIQDEAADTFRLLAGQGFWAEGWSEIRRLRWLWCRRDPKDRKPSAVWLATLRRLDEEFAPKSLADRIRVFVLARRGRWLGYETDGADNGKLQDWGRGTAEALGEEASADPETLAAVLSELVEASGDLIWSFGQGLATAGACRDRVLHALAQGYANGAPGRRTSIVLRGFLNRAYDAAPAWVEKALEGVVNDPSFADAIVGLTCAVPLDSRRIDRLVTLAGEPCIPVVTFADVLGRVRDVPPERLATLLEAILGRVGGWPVALSLLTWAIADAEAGAAPLALVGIGHRILGSIEFDRQDDMRGHDLGRLAAALLSEDQSQLTAQIVIRILDEDCRLCLSPDEFGDLLQALLRRAPRSTLDAFFAARERGVSFLANAAGDVDGGWSDAADNESVIGWADMSPDERYPWLARVVAMFRRSPAGSVSGLNQLAMALLVRAPDPCSFLETLGESGLRKTSGPGDIAKRRALLAHLPMLDNPAVAEGRRRLDLKLREREDSLARHYNSRDARFE
jgi:hypothetical protein